MRHCSDRRSVLLEAVSPEGSGVLLRLRYRDSLVSDSFPIVMPDAIAAVPGAIVVVRYFLRDAPHGIVLDSGTARVTRERRRISARIEGSALENAIRQRARIEFRDVPFSTDTVPCTYEP